MKAKGFVQRKIERMKSEIDNLSICDKSISKRIEKLYDEIKTLERKKKRVENYKARLNSHLEKVKPRLVGEKCWGRKELDDKINKYVNMASWVIGMIEDGMF